MLLQVLGPVMVTGDDGAQVQLRPRERALLAVLLLHAGQPCQTRMLANSLWGDKQPCHPEETVQLYVRRIRKALESQGCPPLVATMYRAYRADPPTGSLDLHRFRSFLAAGRIAHSACDHAPAAELAAKALQCWPNTHDRLPDLPDTPGLRTIACQLAAERHQAQTWLAGFRPDHDRQGKLIPVLGRGGDCGAPHLAPR
jgi:DNA-binding SARP family transcriptional activator